jgi:hypothetical protein
MTGDRGMTIQTTDITLNNDHWETDSRNADITYSVDYVYYPSHHGTETVPYEPPVVEIQRVLIGDSPDIQEHLKDSVIERIKNKILEDYQ